MATWPVDRNEWCKQQKKLKTSRLAGRVILASIYVKYSMEVEGGFPRPHLLNFFDANFWSR